MATLLLLLLLHAVLVAAADAGAADKEAYAAGKETSAAAGSTEGKETAAAADKETSAAAGSTAGAVPDPNIFNKEAVCPKTTDEKACQQLVKVLPAEFAETKDAKGLAKLCISSVGFSAEQFTKDAIAAVQECKKPDKCLDSCVQASTAVTDALKPSGAGVNTVKVPEDEWLLAIHASFSQLLRGPAGGVSRPPLCKTCCDDGSCKDAKKLNVVSVFSRMWDFLDFTDAVLDDLYPLTKTTGTKATTTAGSTADKETSPAAESTADKETSAVAGSTADKNTYPAAGSAAEKETSSAAGSAPVVDTAPAALPTTYV
uniref:Pectinesterase inhibitor domain-containing protein n=1 Tax=Oryza glumipatula TaxID=40148 RepID=A0A0E0BGX2_9ORYZ